MHRLRLRFPYAGQQIRAVDFACLLIGLLVLAGVFYQYRHITEAANYWTVRVERLEQQQRPKTVPRTRSMLRNRGASQEISQEIRQQITKANDILKQINLPWEALFDALEHAVSKHIALLSLQPNVGNQTLRVGGEARNMAVLLDFVEAMEREMIFTDVHLLNYKIKRDDPHQPINFLLITKWIELP